MAFIQATPLGEWIFKSKSKQKSSCGLQGACKGFMFGLQVTELLEIWPEQVTHGRRWVSTQTCHSVLQHGSNLQLAISQILISYIAASSCSSCTCSIRYP